MKKVLFVSARNSCRSLLAESIVNHHYQGSLKAYSAGVEPGEMHPATARVLKEIGLPLSKQAANSPEDFQGEQFDYVITLCNPAREACPLFWTTGEAIYEHMEVNDPIVASSEEKTLQRCRDARDTLEERLMAFFDREIKRTAIPTPAEGHRGWVT